MRPRILALLTLGALVPASAFAGCGVLFWVKQGEEGRIFSSDEEVVLTAGGGDAFLRVFYKGGDESPEITATELGHPWDFGLEGYAPRNQTKVLKLRPQQQRNFNRGRIDLEVGRPGKASIGYQIYSVGSGVKVPESCAVGVVRVRVVPGDSPLGRLSGAGIARAGERLASKTPQKAIGVRSRSRSCSRR